MTGPNQSRWFQRDWTFWFTMAILTIIAAVRLWLLNFSLERDEGKYAYTGQLMLHGNFPCEHGLTKASFAAIFSSLAAQRPGVSDRQSVR